MMQRLFGTKWLVMIGLLLISGCSAPPYDENVLATIEALEQNPLPRPDFIYVNPNRSNSDHCVEISQRAIWEPGNNGDAVYQHIKTSLQMVIDDKHHFSAAEIIKMMSLAPVHIFNDQNEPIAILGGPLLVCAPCEGLSEGKHLAYIRLTSTAGKVFEYSWIYLECYRMLP